MTDTSAPPAPPARIAAAEALGTFVFVLVGCAAVVGFGDIGGFGGSPLAFGFVLVAAMYSLGRISGGHFNPAVTLGAALSGRTPWGRVGVYVGAQLAGAVVAGLVLLALASGTTDFVAFDTRLGVNGWENGFNGVAWWSTLLLEVVLSAVFVLVWLACTDRRHENRAFAPLAVGLALAALYTASQGIDGGSLNPARSLGPALFSGAEPLAQVWVFIVGPLLGAVAGALAYPALFGPAEETTDSASGSGPRRRERSRPEVGGWGEAWAEQRAARPAPSSQQVEQPVHQPVGQQVQQPIIQDGWQWDPQAQRWIPARPTDSRP